jgi:hypothetical protein
MPLAVTKIWAIKDSVSRVLEYAANPEKTKMSDLEQAILYAANNEKTIDENENLFAVTGVNCRAETAIKEMQAVQNRFGKTTRNVAYHAYQSFKTGEISAELCHKLGVQLAEKMWGKNHQVLVATHFNTGTYHNHFVVNSVGMWDGKKYDCNKREYYKLRRISDELCAENNLTIIKNPSKKASRAIYFAEKNGEPTMHNLMREAINKALTMSNSPYQFKFVMRKLGYKVDIESARQYGTISSINSTKNTRLYRLGDEYEKNCIFTKLRYNRQNNYFETDKNYIQFTEKFTRTWVYYNPPTEEYRKIKANYINPKKMLTIEILFMCFAYMLGFTPQEQQKRQPPLSPECREAWRKIEHYSDQIRLVAREKFKSLDDVENFVKTKNLELEAVSNQRDKLRNKLRNAKEPDVITKLKADRDACTATIKALRKEQKTAFSILEKHPKIVNLMECEINCQRENDPYGLIEPIQKSTKSKDYER